MAGQAGKFIIQTGSTMILARLLTPADYGLVAMVTVIANFILMFRDMGLSMATIQKEDITDQQVSNLFWINVVVGVLLATITVLISPLVAALYGEPRLKAITMAYGAIFLFAGVSIQHQALLTRQMQFGRLAILEVLSMIAGLGAGVAAALVGAGYWALVVKIVVAPLAAMLGVICMCWWLPKPPKDLRNTTHLLLFGTHLTAFNVVNYFSRHLDTILVGKFAGPAILGLYDKAYQFMLLPITQLRAPLQKVSTPTLSRLQGERDRFAKYTRQILFMLAAVSMPLMAMLLLLSREVVLVLLGKQWLAATFYFQVMAITGWIQPVASMRGMVLVALGQGGRYLRLGVLIAVSNILSFGVGLALYGAQGVAVAYCVMNYVLLVPSLFYAYQKAPLRVSDFFRSIQGPAIASIAMVVVVYAARSIPEIGHLASVVVVLVLGPAVYAGLLLTVKTWRENVVSVGRVIYACF